MAPHPEIRELAPGTGLSEAKAIGSLTPDLNEMAFCSSISAMSFELVYGSQSS